MVGAILALGARMSRPLRIQMAGLTYHAMSRGNNKARIFLDDLDYARYQQLLGITVERFRLDLWLVCPMPNHTHLVFRTTEPNVSRAMGYLNGRYGQWWNRRHSRVGHVYQGRFKAQLVEERMYLRRLCRYVLMNPVRAGLRSHPSEWKWSSYGALAGTGRCPVDVPSLLRAIDVDDVEGARADLLDYVEGYQDDEMAGWVRSDRRVIGSDEFAKQFESRARGASKEVPRRERAIGRPPLAALLADAVQAGGGLAAGAREAYRCLYPIKEIASCAGISPRVIARIVSESGALLEA